MNDKRRIEVLREENEKLQAKILEYQSKEFKLEKDMGEYRSLILELEALKKTWLKNIDETRAKQARLDELISAVKGMKSTLTTGRIPLSYKIKKKFKRSKDRGETDDNT